LTISGTIGAVSINAANGQIPRVENFIWNSAGDLDATVDISGLTGLKKLVVTVDQTTAVAGIFPTHAGFDTLEIRDDHQTANVALFNTLPTSVTKVIIGTQPKAANYAGLNLGGGTGIFRNVVKEITFTGEIGTLWGASILGGLSDVTLNINGGPASGSFTGFTGFSIAEGGNAIEIVNVGPKTIVFTSSLFDSINLKEINVDNNNAVLSNGNPGDGVLYGKKNGAPNSLIQYPSMKTAPEGKYVIASSTESIANNAFGTNVNLKELTITENVKTIGLTAINNLPNVETVNWNAVNVTSNVSPLPWNVEFVNIGDKVEVIPGEFLGNNWGLESITIPAKVNFIGAGAFNTANDLKDVYFYAENLRSTGAFNLSGLTPSPITSVFIGDKVTNIPDETFRGAGIGEIDLKNVTAIGQGAFRACAWIGEVEISSACDTIGDNAFAECDNLGVVSIYRKALTIGGLDSFPRAAGGNQPAGDLKTIYDSLDGGPGKYVYFGTSGSEAWKLEKPYN
jgi:hypothetical protein